MKILEECPVRDILGNIKSILALLDEILGHCAECTQQRLEPDKVESAKIGKVMGRTSRGEAVRKMQKGE